MKDITYDVAVIGAGAAGMSSSSVTAKAGLKTIVIEREQYPGGILLQCIHNGFGLHHFKEELTGPEYAERVVKESMNSGINLLLSTTVNKVKKLEDGSKLLVCYSADQGVIKVHAKAVILAMGCRERNRGNIGIPGSRPAGVFTAGLAQRLLNIDGYLPGHEAVIVGSGDIGLIMARRLTWVGIKVKAVIEIMPFPSGLTRNIAQCLNDFNIPLYLSHGVTEIIGRDRVSGISVAPLKDGIPVTEEEFKIDCDTILLSVGLVPENELSRKTGVEINHSTGGPYVNAGQMTNVDGVFACGNVLHVHDLVDYVSKEAEHTAQKVIEYVQGQTVGSESKAIPGANVRYVVPNRYCPGQKNHFYLRSMVVEDKAELQASIDGNIVFSKKVNYVKPAEMISVDIPPEVTTGKSGDLIISLAER